MLAFMAGDGWVSGWNGAGCDDAGLLWRHPSDGSGLLLLHSFLSAMAPSPSPPRHAAETIFNREWMRIDANGESAWVSSGMAKPLGPFALIRVHSRFFRVRDLPGIGATLNRVSDHDITCDRQAFALALEACRPLNKAA
jgi:hypothetical protein